MIELAPRFILLEGQGMSGKSEQTKRLAVALREYGISVTITKHPGGIPSTLPLSEELKIRKAEESDFPAEEQFNLMAKSLDLLQEEATMPALMRGDWVVQDRSWSTVEVYQGYEGGYPLKEIRARKASSLEPDLNFFLSVPPKEIIDRTHRVAEKAGREIHAFNPTDLNILTLRHVAYIRVATRNKFEDWRIIDGIGTREEIADRIWQEVANKFGLWVDRKLISI